MFLGIATDKVDTFSYEPNCKCYGERALIGYKQFLLWQLPVGATVGPLPRLHCPAFRLHFHVLRSMSMTFFASSLLFLRRNLPPAAAIEHLFHWIDKHLSIPWLFAFLAIPGRLWICRFTTPLSDGKLFSQELSLFFCKLSSTPCCLKSPPISTGEYSSSTERSDTACNPTVGTFVYSPVILTEWSSLGLVK